MLVLGGGFLAHKIQTSAGVRVEDVRFQGASGTLMSALLYVPQSATPKTRAPGILAIHGYINSRETQDGFAIALARAGYVVLALDQTGHGYSRGTVAANGYGGPDGLSYLRRLPMVDSDNIGLEGHSMGGWAVLKAAAAEPDGYKAMVLEGSATGVKTSGGLASPQGTSQFPRNLAVVYSRYDEFAPLMWEVPRARDVVNSSKLKVLFGSAGPVVPERFYGAVENGNARMLYTPVTTHPGDHISPSAIADAVQWFGRTLKGGRPASDSLWLWKEAGTGAALAGAVALMLGAFTLLLQLPIFSGLAAAREPAEQRREAGWWAIFAATMLIPPLSFYPFMYFGALALPVSRLFPQTITNQVMAWALLNAAITLLLGLWFKKTRSRVNARWWQAFFIASLSVATGYLALMLCDVLFKIDFRFWVVALKLLSPPQWRWFFTYLVPFLLFFVITLGALKANLSVGTGSAAGQYATALAALSGGFVLFLIAEYAPLFVTGALPMPQEALNAILSIQFVPLLAIVAVMVVYTWRRTNSHLPGAFMAGLFVTWYLVAGTAVQFAA
jgi:pimeloyl-ACP methyl ester carboxylesterase